MHKLQITKLIKVSSYFIHYAKHLKEAEGIDANRATNIKNIHSRMSEDQGRNAPPKVP
jgi:hypothetical protein